MSAYLDKQKLLDWIYGYDYYDSDWPPYKVFDLITDEIEKGTFDWQPESE